MNRPVRVKWLNQLVAPNGNFLRPLAPVDQTLHWANPAGDCIDGVKRTDCRGQSQLPYAGPVPVSVHLHGAHVNPDSDGFPEAWFLPAARNVDCIGAVGYPRTPSTADDFFCRGSNYGQIPGAPLEDGAALFQYRNDQAASTLWFHDHSLGMTRTNVYAGPAGFYLLRGGPSDLPSGVPGGLPGGAYEIPLVIQDRSFNSDGSLFYPASRVFFDGYAGPYIGDANVESDVAPLHNPEFFGNTMVVNGKTWPFLNVEPRKYRFRILNGSDSRFLILKFRDGNVKTDFTQIGAEGGFLARPGRAEPASHRASGARRRDRRFLALRPGRHAPSAQHRSRRALRRALPELGPGRREHDRAGDADPRGGAHRGRHEHDPAASGLYPSRQPGERAPSEPERARLVADLRRPEQCLRARRHAARLRQEIRALRPPVTAMLGTIDPVTRLGIPQDVGVSDHRESRAQRDRDVGDQQLHRRRPSDPCAHGDVPGRQPAEHGDRRRARARARETGFKDTVVSFPGEITRIKAVYDIAGLFVWHCHILSHEDNEMMRPYCVGDPAGCSP